jgi:hypothetical protein
MDVCGAACDSVEIGATASARTEIILLISGEGDFCQSFPAGMKFISVCRQELGLCASVRIIRFR